MAVSRSISSNRRGSLHWRRRGMLVLEGISAKKKMLNLENSLVSSPQNFALQALVAARAKCALKGIYVVLYAMRARVIAVCY